MPKPCPIPTSTLEHASYRDLPLNPRGRAQARALGARLAKAKLATIYSSPLKRAAETAKAISNATTRAIAYDERLREVEIGSLDEPRHPAEFGAHLDRLAELAIAHGGWSPLKVRSRPPRFASGCARRCSRSRKGTPASASRWSATRVRSTPSSPRSSGSRRTSSSPPQTRRSARCACAARSVLLVGLNDVAHLQGMREPRAAR